MTIIIVQMTGSLVMELGDGSAGTGRMRNRMKVLRAERNWSQADLAEHLEVSRQTINALETGRYDPSLPLAFRIARLFGAPIEAIFIDDETGPGPAREGG